MKTLTVALENDSITERIDLLVRLALYIIHRLGRNSGGRPHHQGARPDSKLESAGALS